MEKYFNAISFIAAVIGGFIASLLGGWDGLLKTITVLMVLDFLSGWLKGLYTKSMSSEIGFRGIVKKVVVFMVIGGANAIQWLISGSVPLREIVIMFFIANEGLSLVENAAVMIPIPQKFKDVLLQLRDKNDNQGA